MTRVKRGLASHRRHKKMIKAAKGFKGLRHHIFTQAKNAVMKQGLSSYKGRKEKKRTFRSLWIARINAAVRPMGITYSRFMAALENKNIIVNRKMLSELAINEPEVFKAIVEEAKK